MPRLMMSALWFCYLAVESNVADISPRLTCGPSGKYLGMIYLGYVVDSVVMFLRNFCRDFLRGQTSSHCQQQGVKVPFCPHP